MGDDKGIGKPPSVHRALYLIIFNNKEIMETLENRAGGKPPSVHRALYTWVTSYESKADHLLPAIGLGQTTRSKMNRRQATVCPPGKKKRVTTTVRSPTPTIDDHKYETTVTPSPSRFSTNSTQTMISADRSGRIRHSIPSEDVLREEDNNR